MHLRKCAILLAVLAGVSMPAQSWASPLELTFAGQWQFHDSYLDSPDFWDAMASAGVVQGAPLTLSMLLSDTDLNPDPSVGRYSVLTSEFRIANLVLTAPPDYLTLSVDPSSGTTTFGSLFSPLQGPAVGPFAPYFFQIFDYVYPATSDRLADALPYLASQAFGTIAYNCPTAYSGCGPASMMRGNTPLTLTSVRQVPEASSMYQLAIGILFLLGFATLRQRHSSL
jgi:hypothetical protein